MYQNCICFYFQQLAHLGARCDYGIYVGAGPDNYNDVSTIGGTAMGMKMYLNETFTTLRLDSVTTWIEVCRIGLTRVNIYTNLWYLSWDFAYVYLIPLEGFVYK